jgi:tripeptide aminopeptidase
MPELSAVMESSAFETARRVVHETDDLTVRHMVDATGIPSPTGQEAARGRWLADGMRELGLDSAVDDVGNVISSAPCAAPGEPAIVVAAHLDTVFAAGTPVTVRRDGTRLAAPGISDNSRGLAGMLALARSLAAAGWPTRAPVVFVGTVGEEGAGDLRGAKHYMAAHRDRTGVFIALDGAGATRIINSGVGSRRLRVRFHGPGGHSWSDFGSPSAIHAAGRAVAALAALPLPGDPRTTLSVGRIGGGTSVNAIAAEAWIELDLRSEELPPLREIEARVRQALDRAAAAESSAADSAAEDRTMACEIEVFGDRPAGRTPADHALVRLAHAATRAVGLTPELAASSTDANVAMAEGVPAISIGAGGEAAGIHTVGEWYDNAGGPQGLERALLVVLGAAGTA